MDGIIHKYYFEKKIDHYNIIWYYDNYVELNRVNACL